MRPGRVLMGGMVWGVHLELESGNCYAFGVLKAFGAHGATCLGGEKHWFVFVPVYTTVWAPYRFTIPYMERHRPLLRVCLAMFTLS
jgi:hypothetical protein